MDYNATLTADNLGLAYSDYNFLMALGGSLVGFTFLFFTIYLAILIGSSRG